MAVSLSTKRVWVDTTQHTHGKHGGRKAAGIRYLRIWVSGKTGERWLIAKHDCVAVLERIALRDTACAGMTLDDIFAARIAQRLFRFSTGEQPYELNKVFARMLADADLLGDANGQRRTLYSLRYTYARLELRGGTDIHTLARQMGTSVLMLKYSIVK